MLEIAFKTQDTSSGGPPMNEERLIGPIHHTSSVVAEQ